MPESLGRALFTQLCRALEHLHIHLHVVHRDLKLENVLVQVDRRTADSVRWPYTLKLIDFGFAKVMYKSIDDQEENSNNYNAALCMSHKGTLEFMAPELLEASCIFYDAIKTDIYSAGVCLYYMLQGESPWESPSTTTSKDLAACLEMYRRTKCEPVRFASFDDVGSFDSTNHHRHRDRVSSAARALTTSLLASSPDARPSLYTILQHRWMTPNNRSSENRVEVGSNQGIKKNYKIVAPSNNSRTPTRDN